MDTLKVKYQPRIGLFLIGFIVLLAMSIFVLFAAQQPTHSHVIGRVISRLDLDAGLVLTVLGWVGIAFSIAAAGAAYWTKTLGERYVEIGAGTIRTPASNLSKNLLEIPVSDVQNVSMQSIQSTRIITLQHAKGKVEFTSMMFPEKGAFNALFEALNAINENNKTRSEH
ncbi:hypothetical protein ACFOZ5_01225 [Marinobacter lacisalsi]|uniref:DUF304 domain-containing protein n=1 Tax=Marinobacter lacisalsi TaxID=475979 RepID=A0ABV8QE66_9GAMM